MSNNKYENRRTKALENANADAFLVFDLDRILPSDIDHTNLLYLTGYTGEGALLVCQEEAVLFTDSRYLEQVEKEAPDLVLHHAEGDYIDELASTLKTKDIKRLGFSSWHMTHFVVEKLKEVLEVKLVPKWDPVRKIRAVKDTEEIELLSKATKISEEALDDLIKEIEIGMSETDIASRLESLAREKGSARSLFRIVGSGPNS